MSKQEYNVTSRFETTTLLWRIENIMPFLESDNKACNYRSPVFGDKSKWRMLIYNESNYLYCTLKSNSETKVEVAWYKVALRDRNGAELVAKKVSGPSTMWIVNIEDLKTKWKNDLLPDDTLTIFCEVLDKNSIKHLPVVKENTVPGDKVYASSSYTEELATDLRHLLSSRDYCDVILQSSDQQQIAAHRIILHARSPLLADMIHHNVVEKMSEVVEIQDINGDTLQSLLYYIYTNDVKVTSQEKAVMLHAAADRYELQKLKRRCMNYMVEQLAKNNVRDNCGGEDLSETDVEVLKQIVEHVVSSKPWEELASNAKLATEILKVVVANSVKYN